MAKLNSTDDSKQMILERKDISMAKIQVLERAYPLPEREYQKLIGFGSAGCKDWAKRLLFIGIGIAIRHISVLLFFLYSFKTTNNKNDVKMDLTTIDFITLSLFFGLSIILYLIGCHYKNDKDKFIDKLSDFYKETDNTQS